MMGQYIENYLHSIDTFFKNKNNKEIYMIYIITFSLIFTFSYLLFWDMSLKDFIQLKQHIYTIKTTVNRDKEYLQNNPIVKLTEINLSINKLQKEVAIDKDKNLYIKNKIDTISYLLYNEITWGSYINSISKSAKKYNIKILTFNNEIPLSNAAFGHILNINIHSTGRYQDFIKFINSLEQNKLVVDLHGLSMSAKEKLYTDLNISVWGINY